MKEEEIQRIAEEILKKLSSGNFGYNRLAQINDQFLFSSENKLRCAKIDTLFAMKIDGHICEFYFEDETKFLGTYCLNDLETRLSDSFFRINRDTLINIRKVAHFHCKTGVILLENKREFLCAKEKIALFRRCLKKISVVIGKKKQK